MKICILCENSSVELARENSKNVFPKPEPQPKVSFFQSETLKEKYPNMVKDHLGIPCSSSGELPATHWFCFMNVDDETYNKIIGNAKYSVIEQSGPKEFLEKWNLKIIK